MATTNIEWPSEGYNHQQVLFQFPQPLSLPILKSAVNHTIQQYPVLNTRFHRTKNSFKGKIAAISEVEIECVQCPEMVDPTSRTSIDAFLAADRKKGFNWNEGPLFRFQLIQSQGSPIACLLFSFHHILLDGRSTVIICQAFLNTYKRLLDCSKAQIQSPQEIFINQDLNPKQPVAADNKYRKWKLLAESFQPYDTTPFVTLPSVPTHQRESIHACIDQKQFERIEAFRKNHLISLHLFLIAAWAYTLSRFVGKDMLYLDTIHHGRHVNQKTHDNAVGMFIEALPLIISCTPDQSIRDWLRATQDHYIEARNHGPPYVQAIRKHIAPLHTLQSCFMFENGTIEERIKKGLMGWNDLTITLHEKTDVPLFLSCHTLDQGLKIELDFSTDHIDSPMAKSLSDLFLYSIQEIATPERDRLTSIMTPTEWKIPLHSAPFPESLNLVFQRSVAKSPLALAIDSPTLQLTYTELSKTINQRAFFLNQAGVEFGMGVSYSAIRDAETLINLLSILHLGAYCIPLDPKVSITQIDHIITESRCTFFLATSSAQECPQYPQLKVLTIPKSLNGLKGQPVHETRVPLADDPAFLLYTSGSTGVAKGVLCHHGGAANEVSSVVTDFDITGNTRMLQVANPAFDASIEELFATFAGSGTLVTGFPHLLESSWETFTHTIRDQHITHLDLTTSVWHQWTLWLHRRDEQLPESLKVVIVGGERALAHTLNSWFSLKNNQTQWINTYGLTETSIVSTTYKSNAALFQSKPNEDLPIGKPIANTHIDVLDFHGRHVPPGAVGELVVSGIGVCHYYLNASAERTTEWNTHQFHTGDLVRIDSDGNLKYVGRKDRQIKFNGQRVEPSQIETLIRNHPAVTNCYVCLKQSPENQKRLVAYIETSESVETLLPAIQALCFNNQPLAITPQCLLMPLFPLTPNGKIDTTKLPCPFLASKSGTSLSPIETTDLEAKIIQAFALTLGIHSLDPEDSFFTHGGDSLSTLNLLEELHRIGIHVNTQTIRRAPTPRALCAFHLNQTHIAADIERTSNDPVFQRLNNTKHGDSLIAFHSADGTFSDLAEVLSVIHDSLQIYGIYGLRNGKQLPHYQTSEEMISHYADLVIKHAPDSFLFGYCFGGYLAWEVAGELVKRGSPPRGVFLLDTQMDAAPNRLIQLSMKWGKFKTLLTSSAQAKLELIQSRLVSPRKKRKTRGAQSVLFSKTSPTYQYYTNLVRNSRYSTHENGCTHLIVGTQTDKAAIVDRLSGWSHLTPHLHAEFIDSDHGSIKKSPHATTVASYVVSSIVNDWLFQKEAKRNEKSERFRYLESSSNGNRFISIGAESTVDSLTKLLFESKENPTRRVHHHFSTKKYFVAKSARRDGMALLSGRCLQLSESCCALRVPLILGLMIPLPTDWERYVESLPLKNRKLGKWCEQRFTWDTTTDIETGILFFENYARPTAEKRYGREAFYSSENEVKQILRNGGLLIRLYENGDWIGGVLIKPASDFHELYILGVKEGDYHSVSKNTVTALYWFGIKTAIGMGSSKLSLSTVAPYPSHSLFRYKAGWNPQIDLNLTPRLPHFIYLEPTHPNCQRFFASNDMLFWEGNKLALMTGLDSTEAAHTRRNKLRYLPEDTSIYTLNLNTPIDSLPINQTFFKKNLIRKIKKLA